MQVFTSNIRISDFIEFAESRLPEFFTPWEQTEFKLPVNAGSLAARYQLKAMLCEHCGWSAHFHDIEIFRDELGKPILKMHCAVTKDHSRIAQDRIRFSLSHSKEFAAVLLVIN